MSERATAKTRAARLQRLASMLETRVEDARSALHVLLSEAEDGETQAELWELLHAAAVRDDQVMELSSAYEQLAKSKRLHPLPPAVQAAILMHAADFLQGALGDSDGSTSFLEGVVAIVPDHPEAFGRLERRYTAARDDRRLAELYAKAAAAKAEPPTLLIGRVLAMIELLSADKPVSVEACQALLKANPKNPRVLAVVEAHCKKTRRYREAAALLEQAISGSELTEQGEIDLRKRVIVLYLGEAEMPESALPHVEEILRRAPADVDARKAADKLLSRPNVAARVAQALQEARRRVPRV